MMDEIKVVVGILMVGIEIDWSESIKDKRHVVRSMLDVARRKFNVSASEVGPLDNIREAGLAFSHVSNDKQFTNSVLDKALRFVESNPECEVIESGIEFL